MQVRDPGGGVVADWLPGGGRKSAQLGEQWFSPISVGRERVTSSDEEVPLPLPIAPCRTLGVTGELQETGAKNAIYKVRTLVT